MSRFKKVILSLVVAVGIGGCQSHPNTAFQANGKIKILSTTAQIGDLVKEVGGERIASCVLIQGDLDPHSYELVKGDLERLQKADVIFYNGLGLEHGASLSSFLKGSPKAVAVGDRIKALHPEKILWKEGVVDPHLWMDISLWQKGVGPIVEALVEKDPEGAAYYLERGKALEEKMERVHGEVFARIQQVPKEKRYLVTSHDAFHYFTRSYLAEPGEKGWAERFAAPEGLAPEGQLKARDIQNIINFLKMQKVCVLFPESNVSKDSIRKIASAGKELGLEIHICAEPLYGDSMSGLAYLEMMQKNSETIAKNLCTGP